MADIFRDSSLRWDDPNQVQGTLWAQSNETFGVFHPLRVYRFAEVDHQGRTDLQVFGFLTGYCTPG
jgi:hypothetical protein